jgi:phospholipase C
MAAFVCRSVSSSNPKPSRIEHVIVLMLENRSFDHMLGYLPHPDPRFDGLLPGTFTNPDGNGVAVEATPKASSSIQVEPGHTHDGVMTQMGATRVGGRWHTDNQGFVVDYENVGRNPHQHLHMGLFGPLFDGFIALRNKIRSRFTGPRGVSGVGPKIMECQPPENVPVLSKLALEFAVSTRWFSPLPGETWPCRNYAHAGTSDGETECIIRPYYDKTIFELLAENGHDWHIYHDNMPQIWAFPRLYDSPADHARWFDLADFAEHVASDRLPAYAFIEPNHHAELFHAGEVDESRKSNSQHPGNNLPEEQADGDSDFQRGEALIASVYEALRTHPEVFEKTLLVVNYDEHGGFYDHVPPPAGVPSPQDPRGWLARLQGALLTRKVAAFDFTLLGPRVPNLLISPFISAGTIDDVVREHTAIPATLRALFAPTAEPLTRRDAWATPFHQVLDRDEPRRGADLPDLSAYARGLPRIQEPVTALPATNAVPAEFEPFYQQSAMVARHLRHVGEPEMENVGRGSRADGLQITHMFQQAAIRHRSG